MVTKTPKRPGTTKREPLYASDYDKGKYLKWQDLGEIGASMTVSIRDVTNEALEDKQGKREEKPVAWFNGLPKKLAEKGLVLNATNRSTLVDAFCEAGDDDLTQAIDHTVVLFSMMTDFGGKMVGALRIRIPTSKGNGKRK